MFGGGEGGGLALMACISAVVLAVKGRAMRVMYGFPGTPEIILVI